MSPTFAGSPRVRSGTGSLPRLIGAASKPAPATDESHGGNAGPLETIRVRKRPMTQLRGAAQRRALSTVRLSAATAGRNHITEDILSHITNLTGYMTMADIAMHFGCASRTWVEQQLRAGTIPAPIKIAGRRLWSRVTIAAFDAKFIEAQGDAARVGRETKLVETLA